MVDLPQPKMTGPERMPLDDAALSRRDCLASAAAAALGYTLAAGPVRAAAIKTGTDGLYAGVTKVKVAGGEMPVYYAKPAGAKKPRSFLSRWRFSACMSTSRM